jgi:hypothetical protein
MDAYEFLEVRQKDVGSSMGRDKYCNPLGVAFCMKIVAISLLRIAC